MKTAAVCIATYQRPAGLMRLLRAITAQTRPSGWDIEVRVVNNSPAKGIRAWEDAVTEACPIAVVAIESRRNIACARNTAIEMGPADAFVFIDDDEVPTDGWLDSLLRRLCDADAVFGPVIGCAPRSTASWLVKSGAFDKPGPDHDGQIPWTQTRTSSTAVRGEWFGRSDSWFDPDYGISGGSDVEFFRRIAARGARFVHERKAAVFEDIEPDRANWRAVLRRRYRAGAVLGRMERETSTALRHIQLVKRAAAGACIAAAGVLSALAGNPGVLFQGICKIGVGIGAWRGHNPDYRVSRYPAKSSTNVKEAIPCVSPS